jgi:hypothetical protein
MQYSKPEVTKMKTLIVSAALVSILAAVATHSHASTRHVVTPVIATVVQAPAVVEAPTLYVSEQTIVGVVPSARRVPRAAEHVETDAEHVARLMSATPEMVSCAACTPRKPFESYTGHVSHLGDR